MDFDKPIPEDVMRSAYVWNTLSGLIMAFQSVILLVIISHVCGVASAGIFTLAYANANLFLNLGKWGERSYQASDVHGDYSFKEYLVSRIVTGAFMVVGGVCLLAYSASTVGYSQEKTSVVFLMLLFKLVDCLEDVFLGEYQREGRLDVAGKVLTVRLCATMLLYGAIILVSEDQVAALLFATIFAALFVIAECTWVKSRFEMPVTDERRSLSRVWSLLVACLALAIAAFLQYYLNNAPKYAIDAYLDDVQQAYYGYIAMPTFVVSMLSTFIYNPNIAPLSMMWSNGNLKDFVGTVRKFAVVIVGLTVACDAGAYLLGVPVLNLLYHTEVSPYLFELLLLVTGGGFLAVAMLLTSVFAIMRRQNRLIVGYVLTSVFAIVGCPLAVRNAGLAGAAWMYLFSMAALAIVFSFLFVQELRKRGAAMVDLSSKKSAS